MDYKTVNLSILTLLITVPIVLGGWLAIVTFQFKIREIDSMATFVCSELFISQKNATEIKEIIPAQFAKYFTTELNQLEKNIKIKFLNIFTTTAHFRDDLGCYVGTKTVIGADLAIRPHPINRNSTEFDKREIPAIRTILSNSMRLSGGQALLVWYNGSIVAEKYSNNNLVDKKMNGFEFGYILSFLLHRALLNSQQLTMQANKLFPQWAKDQRKDIQISSLYDPLVDFDLPRAKGLIGDNYLNARHHYGSMLALLPFVIPQTTITAPTKFSPIKADLLASYLSNRLLNSKYSIANFFDLNLGMLSNLPAFSFQVDSRGHWMPDMTYATTRDWLKLAKYLYNNHINYLTDNSPQSDGKSNALFAQYHLLQMLQQSNLIRTANHNELNDTWLFTTRNGQIMAISKSAPLIVLKFTGQEAETQNKLFAYTYNQIRKKLNLPH